MPSIPTANLKGERKLFHNEIILVYPTELPLSKIEFWKENDRTIFTFQKLVAERGKTLDALTLDEITCFIARQDIHKIPVLAASIERNGVQIPLIIRDDGKLLDGNRRYFACQWLRLDSQREGKPLPKVLEKIPVLIIKKSSLDNQLELKILAEANFIQDLKVMWPLDAQARAVKRYYDDIREKKRLDHDSALEEVKAVFGIQKQRASDLLDTLSLATQFIDEAASKEETLRRHGIVEDKFVYLWEFRNKAMKGRGALDPGAELSDVRQLFFEMLAKGRDNPIKNVKQVEPMVQAKRDKLAWSMLQESKGHSLPVVVSMMNEKKEGRKDEDRIRIFLEWLKDFESGSPRTLALLLEVSKLAARKSKA